VANVAKTTTTDPRLSIAWGLEVANFRPSPSRQDNLFVPLHIKRLAPDGQSGHGWDSHNHDTAVRADVFFSTDLDGAVFEHRRRSLCGQYRTQIRLTNPSQFGLHR
jgi:hypothetical protein